MKLRKQKTPLSCMWQLRLFKKDWVFGYIKIGETEETLDESLNNKKDD